MVPMERRELLQFLRLNVDLWFYVVPDLVLRDLKSALTIKGDLFISHRLVLVPTNPPIDCFAGLPLYVEAWMLRPGEA